MNILFITSAHNSLSQRLLIQLTDRGHQVSVALATSDEAMLTAVAEHAPDLIIAPMLKSVIPEAIWSAEVHRSSRHRGRSRPVIARLGDRDGRASWGVTTWRRRVIRCRPIWATHEFRSKAAITKSSLYRNQVTEAAVRGVMEAVGKLSSGATEPLDTACPMSAVVCVHRCVSRTAPSTGGETRPRSSREDQRGRQRPRRAGPLIRQGVLPLRRARGRPTSRAYPARSWPTARRHLPRDGRWSHLDHPCQGQGHGPYAGIKLPAMQVLGADFHPPISMLSIAAPSISTPSARSDTSRRRASAICTSISTTAP